jgi:hypothetical protein
MNYRSGILPSTLLGKKKEARKRSVGHPPENRDCTITGGSWTVGD